MNEDLASVTKFKYRLNSAQGRRNVGGSKSTNKYMKGETLKKKKQNVRKKMLRWMCAWGG